MPNIKLIIFKFHRTEKRVAWWSAIAHTHNMTIYNIEAAIMDKLIQNLLYILLNNTIYSIKH